MATLATLMPELERAIKRDSAEKCAKTLRRITDLFIDGASQYNDDHIGLFDDVFSRLIVEIEVKALAELARRLAPVSNAPAAVIRQLAHDDDIAVAAPVLLRSTRLNARDLVDIAKTKSQAHLLAISGRAVVCEAVTDVLVGRGDRDVVRNAAMNQGARFSRVGFATLVERSETDSVLAEKVGQRPDIPPHLFRTLLLRATEVVQKRLLAAARPETQAQIKHALAKVSQEMANAAAPRDYSQAVRTVLAMREAGKLNEGQLAEFAKAGEFDTTVAALSTLCGVPIEVVDRLIAGNRPDAALILCRAAGFGWATACAVLKACSGPSGASPQTVDKAFGNFEQMSPATARRVTQFWQVREANLLQAS